MNKVEKYTNKIITNILSKTQITNIPPIIRTESQMFFKNTKMKIFFSGQNSFLVTLTGEKCLQQSQCAQLEVYKKSIFIWSFPISRGVLKLFEILSLQEEGGSD